MYFGREHFIYDDPGRFSVQLPIQLQLIHRKREKKKEHVKHNPVSMAMPEKNPSSTSDNGV